MQFQQAFWQIIPEELLLLPFTRVLLLLPVRVIPITARRSAMHLQVRQG